MTYGAVQLLLCTIHLPTSVLLSKREIEAYFVKANAFGIFLYSDLDSCLTRKPSLKGAPFDNLCITWEKSKGSWFEQAAGAEDGQGSLVCCSPWGPKELDTTEWLNWRELNLTSFPLMSLCLPL